jgi:NitT/TauT family transport system substrate-binding protein
MQRLIAMLSVLVVLAGLLAACVPPASPAAPAPAATATAPAAAAPAGAAAAPTPFSGPLAKVTASYSELVATELPVWAAQEAGLFQKHGLDVDLQLMESTTGLAALIAGQTQIAQLGGSAVLSAAAGGADVVVLATLAPVYAYVFQVPASIRTLEDLRGQKVGVSRLGSSSDIATRVALRKVGLDPDRDVSIIQVGSSTARTAAMLSGAIQGGVAQPPDNLALEAQGFHSLFDLAALGLPVAQLTVVTQRSYANANRDVVQRYVDALVEATARARRDRELGLTTLRKNLKTDDERALVTTYDYFSQHVVAALPFPRPEQFADAAAELGENNPNIRSFDVARLLDPSFVQSAADRGLGGS